METGQLVKHANSPVYQVTLADGTPAFMRPNDGSAFMLAFAAAKGLTVPSVLAVGSGWILLSSIPGEPLSEIHWYYDEERLVTASCAALRLLFGAKITHGDCTLPNMIARYDDGIYGDVGFVDWGTGVDRYIPGIDISAVTWSMQQYGCSVEARLEVLRRTGWEPCSVEEVNRLHFSYQGASTWESP